MFCSTHSLSVKSSRVSGTTTGLSSFFLSQDAIVKIIRLDNKIDKKNIISHSLNNYKFIHTQQSVS